MAAIELDGINKYAVTRANDIKMRRVTKFSDAWNHMSQLAAHVKKNGVKPAGHITVRESVEELVLDQIPAVARRIFNNQERIDAHCAVWEYNAEDDFFELIVTQAFLDAFAEQLEQTDLVPVFYSLYKRKIVNDKLLLERENVPVVTLVEAQPTVTDVVPFAQAWCRFWSDTDATKPENTFFMLSCFDSPGPLIAHQLLIMAWFLLRRDNSIPWAVMCDDDVVGCRTLNGVFNEETETFEAPDCSKTLYDELFLLEQLVEIRNQVKERRRDGYLPQIYAPARFSSGRDIRGAKGNNPFTQTTRADSFLLLSYDSAISKVPFVNRDVMRTVATNPELLKQAFRDGVRVPWADGEDEPMQRTLAYVLGQSEDYALHLFTAFYTDGLVRTWSARGMILEKSASKGNTRNLPPLDGYHINQVIAIDRLTALTFDPATLVAEEDQADG
ncbi:MAG: hypothetical protein CMP20_15420 [Rickettsiales bacterium]|nr:hypothetical protein [Rickettsiales bacterium]